MDQQPVSIPAAPVFPSSHASGSNLQLDHPPPPHSCCAASSGPLSTTDGHVSPHVAPFASQESYLSNTMPPSSDPHAYTPDLGAWLAMFFPSSPVEEPVSPPPPSSWTVDHLSLCECGAGCCCPGCPEHGISSGSSAAPCSGHNGDTCSSCLDCALVSVPPSQANQSGAQESEHSPLHFAASGQEASSFGLQSFDIHAQQDLFIPPSMDMPHSMR